MKILVIHPFGIGDVLFSLPAAEALRQRGHRLDWIANERTAELSELYPGFGKTWVFNRDELRASRSRSWMDYAGSLIRFWGPIRGERYDACLDWSMGREFAAISLLIGIRRRAGFAYRNRGGFLNHPLRITGFEGRSVRSRCLEAVRLLDPEAAGQEFYPALEVSEARRNQAREWLGARGVGGGMPCAVLAPGGGASWGARAPFKQWPPERFGQLGARLEERGFRVLITGDERDREAVEVCARDIKNAVRVTGLSLAAAAAVLSRARLCVANDGGLLHLANALKVPCVGLYGPVDEQTYGPVVGPNFKGKSVTADVPCRPCYRNFNFPPCRFEKQCLTLISVERVWEEAACLLGGFGDLC